MDCEEPCPETLSDALDTLTDLVSNEYKYVGSDLYAYQGERRDRDQGHAGLWTTQNSKARLQEKLDYYAKTGVTCAAPWITQPGKFKQIKEGLPRRLEDAKFLERSVTKNKGLLHYSNGVFNVKTRLLERHNARFCMLRTTGKQFVPVETLPGGDIDKARQNTLGCYGLSDEEAAELGKKLGTAAVGERTGIDVVILRDTAGGRQGAMLHRACSAAFGEYVGSVDASAFGAKKSTSLPRAQLEYKLVVFAAVTNPAVPLDGTLLERLARGESIAVGRLEQSLLQSQAKIFILCTSLPRIEPLSEALQAGISVFDLTPPCTPSSPDEAFLQSDGFASAVLQVSLEYLDLFRKEGYKEVKGYTCEEVQHSPLEAAVLQKFDITTDETDRLPFQEIQSAVGTDSKLPNVLTSLGLNKYKTGGNIVYRGIKRKAEAQLTGADIISPDRA